MASSGVADRLPAMCGRATLATEVSKTSMNVPSITEKAISHGLCRGLHSTGWTGVAGAAGSSGLMTKAAPFGPERDAKMIET